MNKEAQQINLTQTPPARFTIYHNARFGIFLASRRERQFFGARSYCPASTISNAFVRLRVKERLFRRGTKGNLLTHEALFFNTRTKSVEMIYKLDLSRRKPQ